MKYFDWNQLIPLRNWEENLLLTLYCDFVKSHPESVASEYPYFIFIPMRDMYQTTEGWSDNYWFMKGGDIINDVYAYHYKIELTWALSADASDAEVWDLNIKGIRINRFETDKSTTLANLLETVLLFM